MISLITFSSLLYCKNTVYNNIYKIRVNQLFMLLVRLLDISGLLGVKSWGSQKLNVDFLLWAGESASSLFNG